MLVVGSSFTSHVEALSAVRSYENETGQMFVVKAVAARTSQTNPLHHQFPYASFIMICKHGGLYKPHSNIMQRKRKLQSTAKQITPCI